MSAYEQMTSMERVVAAVKQQEPDRVPLLLFVTLLGARELGLSIEEYFSRAEHVVEGEMRLWSRYGHDCVSSFFYVAAETEAWGGETYFRDDGPPTSLGPPLKIADISRLQPPDIAAWPRLGEVLRATSMLKERAGGEVPLIGVVMSPFSMPVLQLGFDNYIDLIYSQPGLFAQLMAVNEEFCVSWANAQVAAGADAICYFDPVSSPTIIPREIYLRTGLAIAQRTLPRIKALTATHMASGRSLAIIDDLCLTGTSILGVSYLEDLAAVKQACAGRMAAMGNLNGIAMRNWTPEEADAQVRAAIAAAGPGGGFILSDNHGEIPWQVSDEVLMAIAESARKWGSYPLDWCQDGSPQEQSADHAGPRN